MNIRQSIQRMLQRAGGPVRTSAAAAAFALAGFCLLTNLIPGAGVAYAQNTNATIRGQVLDPSGALVPNAHVLVVNKETGVVVFNGKTDSAGTFVAPQVIPGPYKVTVTVAGLKQAVIDNLQATVAQVAAVNVNMQIGQNTETVTVEAKGQELDRSTSDISTLISPQDVQNLPILGRSTENLLAFIPGVTHGGAADSPSTSQLSINGSRTLNTEVLLNGVSTIVASTGSPATLPSPDGVDSFRALTTNAPAEYGRTSGAVISVNTISGTNTYHGSLYFLVRNEAFDANGYFNNLKGLRRGNDRFFQEGGSIGGPVRIPHLYNGHDKTFFFVNYDRTFSPSNSVLTETVPTAAQRMGDLSNAEDTSFCVTTGSTTTCHKKQPIFMPGGQKTAPFGAAGDPINGTGIIPTALLDPAAQKILALLPLPNAPGTPDVTNARYTGNYISQQNNSNTNIRFVARVDEVVTPKDRVSFNVYRYTTLTPNPVTFNPQLNTTWDCSCSNAWLPSVD